MPKSIKIHALAAAPEAVAGLVYIRRVFSDNESSPVALIMSYIKNYSDKYLSMAKAASLPSCIAQTTREAPLEESPAEKIPSLFVM